MSENFYTHSSRNVLKTWFLMASFFALIILFGWVVSLYYNDPSILLFAVIFSIAMNIVSYWYSDKIVLSLYRAREARREEFFDLYTVTENLAITAGLPKPKLYVIDDPSPNAFATGRNKDHAVVCVTTGLLSILDRQELEGVIAHELSHIGNKDMLLSTVVVVLVGFITLASDFLLRGRMFHNSSDDNRGNGVIVIVAIILSILTPIVATIIQLAISRKREFLADSSAALLTRYPEGLANALRKISGTSVPLSRASNATAHLFIANPFGGASKGIAKLFMTHPPVEERIRALLGEVGTK